MTTERDACSYSFSGLHHLQLAIPPRGEDASRRFYTADAFGNRLEMLEPR